MAGAQMTRLLRPGRWLWRMGLGLPILLGLVLALGILVSRFTGSGYEPPEQLTAGRVDEFAVAAPKYFETERFWLVKLESGEILALYDRDTESNCTVPWRPELELLGGKGWFRDACHASIYDLNGRCFSGPCLRGLDRFRVQITDGQVIVKFRELVLGPPLDPNAQPVNPPQ